MPASKRTRVSEKELNHQEIVASERLQLFEREPLQLVFQDCTYDHIYPLDGWKEPGADISFSVSGDPNYMILPDTMMLEAKVKVTNGDGSALVDYAKVAIDSCMLTTLFDRLTMRLGTSHQLCALNHYAYFTYLMQTFLSPKFYQKQMNATQGIYGNTKNYFDKTDETNKGFTKRQMRLAKSSSVYLRAPLYSPLQRQSKAIVNGVGLHITLSLSNDQFAIMSGEPYADQKVVLEKIALTFTRVRIAPEIQVQLLDTLQIVPACYSIKSYSTTEVTVQAGSNTVDHLLLSDVPLPSVAYVLMLSTTRRIGAYSESCYDIDWKYVRHIELVSGTRVFPPPSGWDCNWQIRQFDRMYVEILRTLGSLNNARECGLTYDKFLQGYGLMVFDLSAGQIGAESSVSELPHNGNLRLKCTFKETLFEANSFLCIFEYSNAIYIRSASDITASLAI